MKVITLNIWNGRMSRELKSLFDSYSIDTDVFCLQEIFKAHNTEVTEDYIDAPEKIGAVLGMDYKCLTDNNGLMICYRGEHMLKDHGTTEVFSQGDFKKNLLWAVISVEDKDYLIGNIHGIWIKESRSDTPERIRQSEIIKSVFDKHQKSKILCGDFNLLPDTKSITMLEGGMVNLIRKYNITSTRTKFRKQTNLDKNAEEFADYIFISPDIEVLDFKVLSDEVSDHSPLMISC